MIPVYILSSGGSTKTVQGYFDTSDFQIHYINDKDEKLQVIEVLREIKDKDTPIIIIRDTSVSISENTVSTVLRSINLNDEYDIFYLCKWHDRCDLFRTVSKFDGNGRIVQTSHPFGIQAMILSPSGISILRGDRSMKNGVKFSMNMDGCLSEQLAQQIYKGNITAYTTDPNLFEFNVEYATRNSDMKKRQECLDPPIEEIQANNYSRMWSYIILFLIVLIIAICIYTIVYKT